MNIICNNCVGGRLYQALNEQFKNPFIWNLIDTKDFLYLIENYWDIDYLNFKIFEEFGAFSILVDNKVKIHYPHHIQDDSFKEIGKVVEGAQTHIKYCKMKKYLKDLWVKRAIRMIESGEKPMFVVDDKPNELKQFTFQVTPGTLKTLEENGLRENIVLSSATISPRYVAKNIRLVRKDSNDYSTSGCAKLILNNLKK